MSFQQNGKTVFKAVTCNVGEFPGSSMVRTRAFTAEGPGSIPGWGTKIPQARIAAKNKNKDIQCG